MCCNLAEGSLSFQFSTLLLLQRQSLVTVSAISNSTSTDLSSLQLNKCSSSEKWWLQRFLEYIISRYTEMKCLYPTTSVICNNISWKLPSPSHSNGESTAFCWGVKEECKRGVSLTAQGWLLKLVCFHSLHTSVSGLSTQDLSYSLHDKLGVREGNKHNTKHSPSLYPLIIFPLRGHQLLKASELWTAYPWTACYRKTACNPPINPWHQGTHSVITDCSRIIWKLYSTGP